MHYAAAISSNPAVVRLLIHRGAQVNAEDKRGDSPLHDAAWFNENPGVIRVLLENGADIDAKGDDKKCCGMDIPLRREVPLHYAARNDSPLIIQTLLDAGADPNATDSGGATPLHEAVGPSGSDNPLVVQALLAAGANPNAKTDSGSIPMEIAARRASGPEIIFLLLHYGSYFPARIGAGGTLLHEAAHNDNSEVTAVFIEGFIELGLDINATDWRGNTPLHEAAGWNDNPTVLEVLIENGAEVNARNDTGDTPLHGAAKLNNNPAALQVLIENGAIANARNETGDTPLHMAAERTSTLATQVNSPEVVQLLLDGGADKSILNSNSLTACRLGDHNDGLAGTTAHSRLCGE